jgi:micrococcal nuclease
MTERETERGAQIAAALALALSLLLPLAASAQPLPPERPALVATDGDSLRLGEERIRIIGLDTPEIHHAQCSREFALAMRAKEIAQDLIATGAVEIRRTGRVDRYGRSLAAVSVGGVAWLNAMRAAGAAAREYDGRGRRQGWCR